MLRRVGCERSVELQHVADPGGVVALGGMPQAEVADLVEAARQHMLEEAAHELLAVELTDPPAVGLTVLVTKADGVVVETDDAGVGEGDAKARSAPRGYRRRFPAAGSRMSVSESAG